MRGKEKQERELKAGEWGGGGASGVSVRDKEWANEKVG